MRIQLEVSHGRNLERAPWCYLLWGVPAVVATATASAYQQVAISIMAAGTLWVFSVGWAGVGCFLNARSCGRVHCLIDGIGFPLLAIAGALNVLSVVSFSWNFFWGSFVLILIASFVPEFLWKRYTPWATFRRHAS